MPVAAAVPSGVPGTTSNIPTGSRKTSPTPDSTQSSITETAQYGVNKTIIHTMTPAGRVSRVTAAILVDDAVTKTVQGSKVSYTRRKRSQDELNKIQQIAEAVIGFDAKRGDSISVQNMSFDANAAETDVAAPTWIQESGKAVSNYSSVFRPGFPSHPLPAGLPVRAAPDPETSAETWSPECGRSPCWQPDRERIG
jgi:flagellar M-ring protein FliF